MRFVFRKDENMEQNLLILGAGQYGQMAYEIAKSMGVFTKINFLDDAAFAAQSQSAQPSNEPSSAAEPAVIGRVGDFENFLPEYRYGFVAIGNPDIRRKLTEMIEASCVTPAILVHPTAYVSPSAQLQRGCCIEPHATVQTNAVVAKCSFVASGAVIRHDAFVGEFCHVDCNAVVESLAIVPAGTKIGCNSVFCQEQGLGLAGHNF